MEWVFNNNNAYRKVVIGIPVIKCIYYKWQVLHIDDEILAIYKHLAIFPFFAEIHFICSKVIKIPFILLLIGAIFSFRGVHFLRWYLAFIL